MDFSTLCFEKAGIHQAQAISDLINLTYRGSIGWTTEAAIIQGDRTNRQEIEAAMLNPGGHFFVVNRLSALAACIYIAAENDRAYIGFFSVHPSLQGQGFGSYMLEQAEMFARDSLQAQTFVLFVISQRPELIAFYQRRGYRGTGRIEVFPSYLGVPKIAGLTIEYLEKSALLC
jgi:ribosomal protein S18 acetylase RimI-like enzyme